MKLQDEEDGVSECGDGASEWGDGASEWGDGASEWGDRAKGDAVEKPFGAMMGQEGPPRRQ